MNCKEKEEKEIGIMSAKQGYMLGIKWVRHRKILVKKSKDQGKVL